MQTRLFNVTFVAVMPSGSVLIMTIIVPPSDVYLESLMEATSYIGVPAAALSPDKCATPGVMFRWPLRFGAASPTDPTATSSNPFPIPSLSAARLVIVRTILSLEIDTRDSKNSKQLTY
jgi:hypothetical protein